MKARRHPFVFEDTGCHLKTKDPRIFAILDNANSFRCAAFYPEPEEVDSYQIKEFNRFLCSVCFETMTTCAMLPTLLSTPTCHVQSYLSRGTHDSPALTASFLTLQLPSSLASSIRW